jgi:hypothetical protein
MMLKQKTPFNLKIQIVYSANLHKQEQIYQLNKISVHLDAESNLLLKILQMRLL